jgi:hypothetical protein
VAQGTAPHKTDGVWYTAGGRKLSGAGQRYWQNAAETGRFDTSGHKLTPPATNRALVNHGVRTTVRNGAAGKLQPELGWGPELVTSGRSPVGVTPAHPHFGPSVGDVGRYLGRGLGPQKGGVIGDLIAPFRGAGGSVAKGRVPSLADLVQIATMFPGKMAGGGRLTRAQEIEVAKQMRVHPQHELDIRGTEQLYRTHPEYFDAPAQAAKTDIEHWGVRGSPRENIGRAGERLPWNPLAFRLGERPRTGYPLANTMSIMRRARLGKGAEFPRWAEDLRQENALMGGGYPSLEIAMLIARGVIPSAMFRGRSQ